MYCYIMCTKYDLFEVLNLGCEWIFFWSWRSRRETDFEILVSYTVQNNNVYFILFLFTHSLSLLLQIIYYIHPHTHTHTSTVYVEQSFFFSILCVCVCVCVCVCLDDDGNVLHTVPSSTVSLEIQILAQ